MSNINFTIYDCGTEIPLQIIYPQGPPGGGGVSFTIIQFTESDLVEEGFGGVWYLPIDLDGKQFISARIEQGGYTEFKSIDNLSKHSSWTDHRLAGFSNNDPQNITIVLA